MPVVAESPSSALPAGVEWLPALGGAHLLRAEVGRGDPPVLILQSASGAEHRIEPGPEARFSRSTDYLVPAGLRWSVAALQWPDGSRASLPTPPEERADVIPLKPRRVETPPPPQKPTPLQPLPWMAPPWGSESDADHAAALWRERRATLEHNLELAAEAILRTRESERQTGEAVLKVLSSARSDVQAVRAARAADASLIAMLEAELDAEHSVSVARSETDELAAMRTQLERACHDAALARAEASSLRAELAAERESRARAEAALQAATGTAPRVADLQQHAAAQLQAAATVTRRPEAETNRLLAALDSAATTLRATTPPLNPEMGIAAARESAPGVAPGITPEARASWTAPTPTGAIAASAAATPASATTAVVLAPEPDSSAPDERVLVAAVEAPGLRSAIVALAREDSVSAGSLLAGLLPAQGELVDADLSYDLTVRGLGTFAVTVEGDDVQVQRLPRKRSRSEAEFHLSGEPLALAQLLAGERSKVAPLRPRRAAPRAP